MFEGKTPKPGAAGDDGRDTGAKRGVAGLRMLRWPELVRRLAAARDLRASLLHAGADGADVPESFEQPRYSAGYHGKNAVNLEDSANCKTPADKNGAAALGMKRARRGK